MIYYLQCSPDGPIKIGYTDGSINGRIRQLQATSPHVLVALGAHEGSKEDERCLHGKFAKFRVRAEWFQPSDVILSHIAAINGGNPMAAINAAERPDLKAATSREAQRGWLPEHRRAFREATRSLGYGYGAWREGAKPIKPAHQRAIENFLNEHGLWEWREAA